MSDQDRTRQTSNVIKHLVDVEETIPDFYGPQTTPPIENVKKGDMWFRYSEDEPPESPEEKQITLKTVRARKTPIIKKLSKE